MPIYLCSGSVCRMRSRRSFYIFTVPALHTISLARLIGAKSESAAKDIFWNQHIRPRIRGFRWPAQHMEIREVSPEELQKLLVDTLVEHA
ncbi:hypothetical protein JNK62_04330 [bacterium]|nr:hypothetical protein [bacterium]